MRLAGAISGAAQALHELQPLHHVREDGSETSHLPQHDAELGTDQALIVVAFLRATLAHGAAHRYHLGIIWHEVVLFENGENGIPSATTAFVFPTLENVAAAVSDAEFTSGETREILCHARCYVVADLYHDAPKRRSVKLQIKIEKRIHGGVALKWRTHRCGGDTCLCSTPGGRARCLADSFR